MKVILFLMFFSFMLGIWEQRRGSRARGWPSLALCALAAVGFYVSLGLI